MLLWSPELTGTLNLFLDCSFVIEYTFQHVAFGRELVFNLNLTQLRDFTIGWEFKENVLIVLSQKAYDIVALELDTLGKFYMFYAFCRDG